MSPVSPQSGGPLRRLGRYTILEDLAKGGMAQVFIAQRDNSPDICVLKQLLGELETHATAGKRFYREAHVASYLNHPRIARTIDAGVEDDTFCIAMEFIAGRDVETMMHLLMRQGRMLPYQLSFSVVLGVLEGLEYAHDAKDPEGTPLELVHRDLSPRNVMLSYEGDVKVIDFGLARGKVDDFKTAPGMILGTLRYVSPEQAVAEPIDRRSDLYSVSVVLYEMLTGRPLVRDGKPLDVLSDVVQRVPEPISARNPQLPRALDAVMARALEKKREHRYPNARELRLAIEHAAGELARTPRSAVGEFVSGLFPSDREHAYALIERGHRRHQELSRGKQVEAGMQTMSPVTPRELTSPEDPGSVTRTGFADTGGLTKTGWGEPPTDAAAVTMISPAERSAADPAFEPTRAGVDPHSQTRLAEPISVPRIVDPATQATRVGGPRDTLDGPLNDTRLLALEDRTAAVELSRARAKAPPKRPPVAALVTAGVAALAAVGAIAAIMSQPAPLAVVPPDPGPSRAPLPVGALPPTAAPVAAVAPTATPPSPSPSASAEPSPTASPSVSPRRSSAPSASPRRSPEATASAAPASPKPATSELGALRARMQTFKANWDVTPVKQRGETVERFRREVLALAPKEEASRFARKLDDSTVSGDESDIQRLLEALNEIARARGE